jgi:hypothetical protein
MPSVAAVTEIGSAVARTSAAIVYEKIVRPRPTTLDRVPPSPAALTAEWLTAALCSRVPGARVEHFKLGPKNDGTSARRTLEVTYNAAGGQAGLPVYLFTAIFRRKPGGLRPGGSRSRVSARVAGRLSRVDCAVGCVA